MKRTRFLPQKSIIGMIHVDALPGTALYAGNMAAIISKAKEEAKIFSDSGMDAIAIENMHDTPYLNKKVGLEIVASMAVVANEVKSA